MVKRIRIAASLAAAPFDHLKETIRVLEDVGVDMIHFDIEDGIFVPMITLGTAIIRGLRPFTQLPFDVHLMMQNPDWLIKELADDGANIITVHAEACAYPKRTLNLIKQTGCKAGLALNPFTSLPNLDYLLSSLDVLMILTTEPEYPNAKLLLPVLDKIKDAHNKWPDLEIEVDGGINFNNIANVITTGATILVSGRSIFEDNQIFNNVTKLQRIIKR